jgi:hypothetical protein
LKDKLKMVLESMEDTEILVEDFNEEYDYIEIAEGHIYHHKGIDTVEVLRNGDGIPYYFPTPDDTADLRNILECLDLELD